MQQCKLLCWLHCGCTLASEERQAISNCVETAVQHAACKHLWSAAFAGEQQPAFIIPQDTAIHTAIMADANKRTCSLQVTTSNDTVIRGVMLFAEHVSHACPLVSACPALFH